MFDNFIYFSVLFNDQRDLDRRFFFFFFFFLFCFVFFFLNFDRICN